MTGDRIVGDDRDGDDWAVLFQPLTGATGCPPPELVQASRAGTLPPGRQEAVARHVSECVVCGALGDALDSLSTTAPTAAELRRIHRRIHELPTATRRPWAWRRRGVAAAAAAAAIVAVLTWLASRVLAPEDRVRPAVSPTGDASLFAIEPVPILSAGPAAADAMSSADQTALSVALGPYRAGDFREARRRLNSFVASRPDRVEGHFYLGISELGLSSPARAVAMLETAERLAGSRPYLARDVTWYLAVAYARAGRTDAARELVVRLCRDPRGGSRRACDALAELASSVHLHGIVADVDGRPIAGAIVSEHSVHGTVDLGFSAPTHFAAATDSSGAYAASGVPWSPRARLIVRATAAGYFTATASVPVAPEARADFTLYPLRYIPDAGVVRGATVVHPICEIATEPCQRYALTVTRSGTLEIAAATADRAGLDLYVETPDGKVYGPGLSAPLRLSFPAAAGEMFQIRVLSFDGPREFELTTRMR